jgi:hypothetical protein
VSLLFSFGIRFLRIIDLAELNVFATGFTGLPGFVEVVYGDRWIPYDEHL